MTRFAPENTAVMSPSADGVIKLTMLLGGIVFLLMMVFGLIMRVAQGGLIEMDPALFYQLLTAHGAGMVGSAALSGAAILWYFTSRHLALRTGIYLAFLSLFLAGVVLILGSIFIGGYGGAWTFLYPLPALSGGAWETGAAVAFVLGYLLIGVGFLLYYLELGIQIVTRYGGLWTGLGWRYLFTGNTDNVPPPTIIAASSVLVFNTTGIVFGAAVIAASIINLLFPEFTVDALLAKNAIYFFGHVFINATIYMAVTAVYEILPTYTKRPWKTTRLFVGGWAAVVVFVQAVYFHHTLQDVNMPAWTMAVGQIVSYASGVPLIAITVFSLAVYIKGSGLKWDLPISLLVLGTIGWGIGALPAIIDGMVAVNKVMHNTQWVPGHFHTYLLLGEVAMAFGFAAWLVRDSARTTMSRLDKLVFRAYVGGGAGLCADFPVVGCQFYPATMGNPLCRVAVSEPTGQHLCTGGGAGNGRIGAEIRSWTGETLMRGALQTLGAALLGCTAILQATDGLQAFTAEGARRLAVARTPRAVPEVPLETMTGDSIMLQASRPALVEFIYTTCPTICQTSGGDFAELRDHLAAAGLEIPMYSISFDPEVDDREALQTYGEAHTATGNPWTVARPRIADLEQLLRTFEVTVIPDGWGGYTHNIAVLLINADGQFAGVYDTRAFKRIEAAVRGLL